MKIGNIDKVLKPLDDFISRETEMLPFSDENGFVPIKINKENFHELGLFGGDNLLCGIDGGNAEILAAPNFSLSFIRTAAIIYKGNKRSESTVKEFFCFVKAVNKENKLSYDVEIFGDDLFGKKLSFGSNIETLDGERYKLETASISGIVRRLAELKLAADIISKHKNISLVIDGSINAKYKEEIELIKEIISAAKEKGNAVGFLSKTSGLLTKNAYSLNSALNELGPKSSWFYHPVFEIKNGNFLGDIYFIKLNGKSKHVFKLDVIKESNNISDYILQLSYNSSDPVFYGYPYCLVEADRAARVSNKENEYLKTVFLSKIKNKERLQYLLSNLNAHDILDNIG